MSSSPVARSPRRIQGLDATQRRERREQLLVEAALDLFAARGYWGTSIEQICQAAYVSTKSFYELFENKEACFLQVLRVTAGRIEAQLSPPKHASTATETDAVDALIDSFVHALVDDPRVLRIVFGGSVGGVSSADDQHRRAARHRAAERIESIWRRFGVVDDRVRPSPSPKPRPEPRKMAIALIGGVSDLISDWQAEADPGDPEAVESLTVELQLLYDVIRAGLSTRLRSANGRDVRSAVATP